MSRAVGRDAHRSVLATLHRTCSLPDAHVRLVEHIPVTSPARTIFDLAGVLPAGRAERALDNAVSRRLTTVQALHRVTGELARHGRPGSATMRRLLASRDASFVPAASGLEARFESILCGAGLPPLVRQRDVGGDDWVGRVDYVDPHRKLVVEIDSDVHHSTPLDVAADARRDGALHVAGFQIVTVREFDVWHRPDEVVKRFLTP